MIETIGSYFAGTESGKANIKDSELVIKKLSEQAKKGVFAQILDAKALCSAEQCRFAAKQAIEALEEKNSFSNRLEIELLLRVTATRQIGNALEIAGIRNGTKKAVIIALSKDRKKLEETKKELEKEISLKKEKDCLEKDSKKNREFLMRSFGIKEKELFALKDTKNPLENAIIEKIALNSLNK